MGTSGAERAFHRIVARLDYPMFVVTAVAGQERSGCLVGFASQCSIHPPRFVVWISKRNHTFPVAGRAARVVIHALGPDDRGLAELFGHETGDEIDKFERCAWEPGPAGVPVLAGVSWFSGPVLDRLDTGDHLGLLLDLDAAFDHHEPGDLGFQRVRDIDPGHEP